MLVYQRVIDINIMPFYCKIPFICQEREEHMASEILRRHVSGAQCVVLCCPARCDAATLSQENDRHFAGESHIELYVYRGDKQLRTGENDIFYG